MKIVTSLFMLIAFATTAHAEIGKDCSLIQQKAQEATQKGYALSSMVSEALSSCELAPNAESVRKLIASVQNDSSANHTIVSREIGSRAAIYLLNKRVGISIQNMSWDSESPNYFGDAVETEIELNKLNEIWGLKETQLSEVLAFRSHAASLTTAFTSKSSISFGNGQSDNSGFSIALGDLLTGRLK